MIEIKDGEPCIYLLQEDGARLKDEVIPRCKIGSTEHLDVSFSTRRLQVIRSTSPEQLLLIHAIKMPSMKIAMKTERFLHKYFIAKQSFEHSKEWCDLGADDIRWLRGQTFESLKALLLANGIIV